MIINNIIFNNTSYWNNFIKPKKNLLFRINKIIYKKNRKHSRLKWLVSRNYIRTVFTYKKKHTKKDMINLILRKKKEKYITLQNKQYHNILFKYKNNNIKDKNIINKNNIKIKYKMYMEKINKKNINNKYNKLLKNV